MLYYAIVFAVLALIAGFLGFMAISEAVNTRQDPSQLHPARLRGSLRGLADLWQGRGLADLPQEKGEVGSLIFVVGGQAHRE